MAVGQQPCSTSYFADCFLDNVSARLLLKQRLADGAAGHPTVIEEIRARGLMLGAALPACRTGDLSRAMHRA